MQTKGLTNTLDEQGNWEATARRLLSYLDLAFESFDLEASLSSELRSLNDVSRLHLMTDPSLRVRALRELRGTNNANDVSIGDLAGAVLSRNGLNEDFQVVGATRVEIMMPDQAISDHPEWFGVLKSEFDEVIRDSVSSSPASMVAPTPFERQNIESAVDRLRSEGGIATDVLRHVRQIIILDQENPALRNRDGRSDMCQNVSTHQLPGCVFLTPTVISSQEDATEALFHEACHKQLSDLVATQEVFSDGYDVAKSQTVEAIWNENYSWNSNEWSTDRALFALHFYTLATEHALAMGVEPDLVSIRKSRFLALQLDATARQDLGSAGSDLLDRLKQLVDKQAQLALDDLPNTDLLILRLIRFNRSTRRIRADHAKLPASDIEHLVHSEIVAAFRLLAMLGQDVPPNFIFYEGDNWLDRATSELLAPVLAELRIALRNYTAAIVEQKVIHRLDVRNSGGKSLLDVAIDALSHDQRHPAI